VRQLATTTAGRVAVVDADGRLVGVLTKADVVRWLQSVDEARSGDGGGATKPRTGPMAD
jgi:CBS domain-containing protein